MVISISKKLWEKALDGDKSVARTIRQILVTIEMGRNGIIFEKGVPINDIVTHNEFISFSEIIKAHFKRDFYNENHQIVIRVTYTGEVSKAIKGLRSYFDDKLLIQLTSSQEFRFLDISSVHSYIINPLYIVVENRNSDGFVIKKLYEYLSERELNAVNVQFVHGGGDTIVDVVNGYLASPIRLICIIDSDKKYPTQDLNLSQKIRKLSNICENNALEFHVLNKRELENYLPDRMIKKWLETKKRASELSNEFFLLDNVQKAFFDLKKGIKVKDFQDVGVQELYPDMYSSQLYLSNQENPNKILVEGFGRDIWKVFEQVSINKDDLYEDMEEFSILRDKIESIM